jgi:amino-acid N-acetyltransferase
MRVVVNNGPATGRRGAATAAAARPLKRAVQAISVRAAAAADAAALHALIAGHTEEGHLLPRTLGDLTVHAARFVVAVRPAADGDRIVGCAELAPLSASVAEVRSLVVAREARKLGLAQRMVNELGRRARREGFVRLCAFAHDPAFFVHLGFGIVPHTWLPEKIAHDCHACPLFRNCGQYALELDLEASVQNVVTNPVRNPRVEPARGTFVKNLREEPHA